ncbi:MAG: multidrug transporter ATPase, partial [Frankiales bacterium]|nr:multidrug transporter ATPase [Frankiales bacterium]
VVMDDGLVVAVDTSDQLKARLQGDVITLLVDGDLDVAEQTVRAAVGVRGLSRDGQALLVAVERGDVAIAPVLRALDLAGLSLRSVSVARPTLDDVFLTLTGRSLRESDAAA